MQTFTQQFHINEKKVALGTQILFSVTAEDILPSDQSGIIEQFKFTHSPLGKAFEKQLKNNEENK